MDTLQDGLRVNRLALKGLIRTYKLIRISQEPLLCYRPSILEAVLFYSSVFDTGASAAGCLFANISEVDRWLLDEQYTHSRVLFTLPLIQSL